MKLKEVPAAVSGIYARAQPRKCKPVHHWAMPKVGDDALVCQDCGRTLRYYQDMTTNLLSSISNGRERHFGEDGFSDALLETFVDAARRANDRNEMSPRAKAVIAANKAEGRRFSKIPEPEPGIFNKEPVDYTRARLIPRQRPKAQPSVFLKAPEFKPRLIPRKRPV